MTENPWSPGAVEFAAPKKRAPRLLLLLALAIPLMTFCRIAATESDSVLDTASVRVVDPDGRPVPGVMVLASWSYGIAEHTKYLGESRADGAVDLAAVRAERPRANFGRFEVYCEIIGGPLVVRRLATGTELPVPHYGKLRVRLVDETGTPWHDASVVHLSAQAQWSQTSDDGKSTGFVGHSFHYFAPDGTIDFGWMAVGAKVDVAAILSEERICRRVQPLAHRGELRVHDVCVRTSGPQIRGRLVDSAGRPLRLAASLDIRARSLSMSAWTVETDADGSFCFRVGEPIRESWTLKVFPRGWSPITLQLDAWQDASVFDLGELLVHPLDPK